MGDLENLLNSYRLEARDRFREHKGFTDKEVDRFQHEFKRHDHQKHGCIDGKDLRCLLSNLFPNIEEPQGHAKVVAVLKEVVGDDGKLDFDEYLVLMRVLQDEEEMRKYMKEKDAIVACKFSRSEVSEFRSIFQAFDTDCSGEMTFVEFEVLLTQIFPENLVFGERMSHELEVLMTDVLGETDGEERMLDFPGFLQVMRRIQDVDFGGINEQVACQASAHTAPTAHRRNALVAPQFGDGLHS